MFSNRREFLGMASTLLATTQTVPAFLTRTAWAAAGKGPTNDRVLVVLQLTGGNDGLNTVVPFTDPVYRRLRPTLSLADAKLHKLDDRVGLHPSMEGVKKIFDAGQAAVVQSVGYPNPNRSHFESMAIWQLAPNDAQLRHGRADLRRRLARPCDRPAGRFQSGRCSGLARGDWRDAAGSVGFAGADSVAGRFGWAEAAPRGCSIRRWSRSSWPAGQRGGTPRLR